MNDGSDGSDGEGDGGVGLGLGLDDTDVTFDDDCYETVLAEDKDSRPVNAAALIELGPMPTTDRAVAVDDEHSDDSNAPSVSTDEHERPMDEERLLPWHVRHGLAKRLGWLIHVGVLAVVGVNIALLVRLI